MSTYDESQVDWNNVPDIRVEMAQRAPKRGADDMVDKDVSNIVGKKIMKNDPRLVRLVVENTRGIGETQTANLLKRGDFIEKLKKEL